MNKIEEDPLQMKNLIYAVLGYLLASVSLPSAAMTFRLADDQIEANGPIEAGDTSRLKMIVNKFIKDNPNADSLPTVSLNSPGGSLLEGINLGVAFREHGLATLVEKGKQCHSACAVAFLGGTQGYATGIGVGRYLETGAQLGFHGFYAGENRVVLLNDAFDTARAINGLVIGYASQLTQVDLTLLSELLSVGPAKIQTISTPREIRGLGISIRGTLPPRPNSWGLNACALAIERSRPISDQIPRLSVGKGLVTIKSVEELRRRLLDDIFPAGDSKRPAMASLSPTDLIEHITGESSAQPQVQRFDLAQGAGFYWHACYSLSTGDSISVLLAQQGRYRMYYLGDIAGYQDRSKLW